MATDTDTISATFAALADPTRRAILARLAAGPATVKELSAPFAMSGPAVSKHLRVLERAGLVVHSREAQRRPRRLEAAPLKEVADWAAKYRRFWDPSFERLDAYLETLKAQERFMATTDTTAKVGTTTFTTPSDLEIVATRAFDAPRELVWEAYTSPEHVARWMLGPEGWTMPVCEIDLRPGGAWRFAWRKADGTEMEMRGVYQEIVPPERLVNTESWGGDWPETIDTLVLSEEGGKTTLTVTVLFPSKEARDRALGTGMKEGWSISYDRLEEHLQTMV
jgi:uncharacterized protein YndB with AHSA1/START domain/DNA-binding transcriptional ArsR family regulator